MWACAGAGGLAVLWWALARLRSRPAPGAGKLLGLGTFGYLAVASTSAGLRVSAGSGAVPDADAVAQADVAPEEAKAEAAKAVEAKAVETKAVEAKAADADADANADADADANADADADADARPTRVPGHALARLRRARVPPESSSLARARRRVTSAAAAPCVVDRRARAWTPRGERTHARRAGERRRCDRASAGRDDRRDCGGGALHRTATRRADPHTGLRRHTGTGTREHAGFRDRTRGGGRSRARP